MRSSNLKKVFCNVIIIVVFCINILFGLYSTSSYYELSNFYRFLVFAAFLVFHLGFYALLKYWTDKNIGIDKIFGRFLLIIGFFYLVLIPFNKVPDEGAHFLRVYEISEGHLVSQVSENGGGREVPAEMTHIIGGDYSTYSSTLEEMKIHASDEKIFFAFSNTALYPFLSYIPQAVGVFIARIFTSSLLIQAYVGRIFNFVLCAVILIIAFKMLPCFKRFFFAICFLPIVLQQLISLSPDGITISLSFLLISYILRFRYDKKRMIEKKDVLALGTITTILSICKIVYMPLCLLIFLIPKEKFQSAKQKYFVIGIMAFWVVCVNLLWLIVARNFLVEYNEGVNSFEQVLYILKNPIHYGLILAKTISVNSFSYIFDMMGQTLECLSLELSLLYSLVTLFIVSYIAYQDHDKKVKIDLVTRVFLGIVLIMVVVLIYTSLYVQWTPVGKGIIDGVQGRYFLPLLLLLPGIFYHSDRKIQETKNTNLNFMTYFICYNLYALILIFMNHIG